LRTWDRRFVLLRVSLVKGRQNGPFQPMMVASPSRACEFSFVAYVMIVNATTISSYASDRPIVTDTSVRRVLVSWTDSCRYFYQCNRRSITLARLLLHGLLDRTVTHSSRFARASKPQTIRDTISYLCELNRLYKNELQFTYAISCEDPCKYTETHKSQFLTLQAKTLDRLGTLPVGRPAQVGPNFKCQRCLSNPRKHVFTDFRQHVLVHTAKGLDKVPKDPVEIGEQSHGHTYRSSSASTLGCFFCHAFVVGVTFRWVVTRHCHLLRSLGT
jgi:hypothetical protein